MSVFDPTSTDARPVSEPSPEPPRSSRTANGTFAPGNSSALRHGLYSRQVREALLPEQAEVRAALAEQRKAIEDDLGGADALSQMTRDLIGRYVELRLVGDFLAHQLATVGPLTGKGRTRAATSAWLAVVDRQNKLALTLGLERRTKRIPTLTEVLDGQ
ncbi:MAG: hypothetical protein AB7H93_13325 [Vicinamibacterales bacterium]